MIAVKPINNHISHQRIFVAFIFDLQLKKYIMHTIWNFPARNANRTSQGVSVVGAHSLQAKVKNIKWKVHLNMKDNFHFCFRLDVNGSQFTHY